MNIDIKRLDAIEGMLEKGIVLSGNIAYVNECYKEINNKRSLIFDRIENVGFSNVEHFINFSKLAKKKPLVAKNFPALVYGATEAQGFIVEIIKDIKKTQQ